MAEWSMAAHSKCAKRAKPASGVRIPFSPLGREAEKSGDFQPPLFVPGGCCARVRGCWCARGVACQGVQVLGCARGCLREAGVARIEPLLIAAPPGTPSLACRPWPVPLPVVAVCAATFSKTPSRSTVAKLLINRVLVLYGMPGTPSTGCTGHRCLPQRALYLELLCAVNSRTLRARERYGCCFRFLCCRRCGPGSATATTTASFAAVAAGPGCVNAGALPLSLPPLPTGATPSGFLSPWLPRSRPQP